MAENQTRPFDAHGAGPDAGNLGAPDYAIAEAVWFVPGRPDAKKLDRGILRGCVMGAAVLFGIYLAVEIVAPWLLEGTQ